MWFPSSSMSIIENVFCQRVRVFLPYGIRIALGSSLARAIGDAALPGVLLALAGVVAGCLLAGLSAKVLEHLVWGVSATDPVTYLAVALGLVLVAATASLAPALRIAKLNPADTLREE